MLGLLTTAIANKGYNIAQQLNTSKDEVAYNVIDLGASWPEPRPWPFRGLRQGAATRWPPHKRPHLHCDAGRVVPSADNFPAEKADELQQEVIAVRAHPHVLTHSHSRGVRANRVGRCCYRHDSH